VNEDWEDVPESASSDALAETEMVPLTMEVAPQATEPISDSVLAQAETGFFNRAKKRKQQAAAARARQQRAQ